MRVEGAATLAHAFNRLRDIALGSLAQVNALDNARLAVWSAYLQQGESVLGLKGPALTQWRTELARWVQAGGNRPFTPFSALANDDPLKQRYASFIEQVNYYSGRDSDIVLRDALHESRAAMQTDAGTTPRPSPLADPFVQRLAPIVTTLNNSPLPAYPPLNLTPQQAQQAGAERTALLTRLQALQTPLQTLAREVEAAIKQSTDPQEVADLKLVQRQIANAEVLLNGSLTILTAQIAITDKLVQPGAVTNSTTSPTPLTATSPNSSPITLPTTSPNTSPSNMPDTQLQIPEVRPTLPPGLNFAPIPLPTTVSPSP